MTTATAGAGVVDDVASLTDSLRRDDWLDAGLGGATTATDLATAAIDPIGTLAAAGLGWLIEHLDPLHSWLADLTGNAEGVERCAQRWDSIGTQLDAAADDLRRHVAADLAPMSGDAIDAYRAHAEGMVRRVGVLGGAAAAVAQALRVASTVIETVAALVRDALAQVVGSAISSLAEETISLGLATPVVVTQIVAKVSRLAARVGGYVHRLLESVPRLTGVIEGIEKALRKIGLWAPGVERQVRHGYEPRFPDGALAPHATRPSLPGGPDARPRGRRSVPGPDDNAEKVRGLARENDSAEVLASRGYDIEQNPTVSHGKAYGQPNPDYRIEGRIFDNYAPRTGNVRNIADRMARKVSEEQADRLVVNLSDSAVSIEAVAKQLADWPIDGLKEVIVIRGSEVVHLLAVP